ncbi:MAG: hypothetical protein ACFFAN_00905 [Promethearchaeota archaeon]
MNIEEDNFFEEEQIEKILQEGEKIILHYSYRTNVLDGPLWIMYLGLIVLSVLVIFMFFSFYISSNISFIIMRLFFSVIPLAYIYKGFKKCTKILQKTELHPDNLKNNREFLKNKIPILYI